MTTYSPKRLVSTILICSASLTLAGCDIFDKDDDTQPIEITVTSASVAEGKLGTSTLSFEVSVTPDDQVRQVVARTLDGSAVADSDYVPLISLVTIPAGESSQTIAITILGDEDFETDETFMLHVTAADGAWTDEATGIGTINNDDLERDVQVSSNYSYDDLNRLVRVDYDNGKAVLYAYDAAGNIMNVEVLEP